MPKTILLGLTFLLLGGVADAGRLTLKEIKETKGRAVLDATASLFRNRVSLTGMRRAVGKTKDHVLDKGGAILNATIHPFTTRTAGKIASGTVTGSIGAALGVALGALEGALDSVGLGPAKHRTKTERVRVPLRDVRITVPKATLENPAVRESREREDWERLRELEKVSLGITLRGRGEEIYIPPSSKSDPPKRSSVRNLLEQLKLQQVNAKIETQIEPRSPLQVEVPVAMPQRGGGRDTVLLMLIAGTLGYFGLTPDKLPLVGEHALWLMNHIDPRLLVEHGLDCLVPAVKAGAVGAAFNVAAATAGRAIKGGILLGYKGAELGAALAEKVADR